MKSVPFLLAFFLFSNTAHNVMAMEENSLKPQVGQYGFNWYQSTSKCIAMTSKILKKFKSGCTIEDGSFGGECEKCRRAYKCPADGGEYLVYATKNQCQQALETMHSNE